MPRYRCRCSSRLVDRQTAGSKNDVEGLLCAKSPMALYPSDDVVGDHERCRTTCFHVPGTSILPETGATERTMMKALQQDSSGRVDDVISVLRTSNRHGQKWENVYSPSCRSGVCRGRASTSHQGSGHLCLCDTSHDIEDADAFLQGVIWQWSRRLTSDRQAHPVLVSGLPKMRSGKIAWRSRER